MIKTDQIMDLRSEYRRLRRGLCHQRSSHEHLGHQHPGHQHLGGHHLVT